ncbi:MAG: hypothetical protein ACM3O4_04220 [Ignavibacteriales bacterium]
MELKQFKDYTPSEKKEILLHWWHYFGKVIYTFEEMQKFSEMIDSNSDEVMMMAVIGYVNKVTNQPIIMAMRENKLDQLRESLPTLEKQNDEFRASYYQIEQRLIEQLVKTYNNPEPAVPMDIVISVSNGEKDGNITKIKKKHKKQNKGL